MKNKVECAALKIIQALKNLVANEKDWNPKVYIGKTNDESRRAKEHLEDPEKLVYLTVVAEGSEDDINELEKLTIELLKKSSNLNELNINDGGGGSSHATKLYVAFSDLFPTDEFGEYEKLLDSEFPITL